MQLSKWCEFACYAVAYRHNKGWHDGCNHNEMYCVVHFLLDESAYPDKQSDLARDHQGGQDVFGSQLDLSPLVLRKLSLHRLIFNLQSEW